ncbi:hypothetical protein SDC9_166215 [bioreactor metagenome]|uniref:Uncharacterized protein n=1 Tax=bioreactor metagenome TaxID=1076179 RepID=A0A645FYX0_9ZZZZ
MNRREDLRIHPTQKQRQRNREDDRNVDGNDILDRFFDVGINPSSGSNSRHQIIQIVIR